MQTDEEVFRPQREPFFCWRSVAARTEFARRLRETLTAARSRPSIPEMPLQLPDALSIADDAAAVDLVRRYFERDEEGRARYTGSRFDNWQGGGLYGVNANRITDADINAVAFLSVEIPPRAVIELVERRAAEIEALLSEIPMTLELHLADAAAVSPGSKPDQLWHLLQDVTGVGWVTAGKLCARKRPQLLPVYDERVKLLVGAPDNFWEGLRQQLRADDHELARRLDSIRQQAAADLSIIRVFDVIAWMEASDKLARSQSR